MRTMTLILAALAVVTASGAAAPGPVAAQGIEVLRENPTGHCPSITVNGPSVSGGCYLHGTSDGPIVFEAFGSPMAACDSEYDLRIDEAGHGYVYNQVLSGPDCTTTPCEIDGGGGNEPWEFSSWEVDVDTIELGLSICSLFPGLPRVVCRAGLVVLKFAHHVSGKRATQSPCEAPWDFMHVTGSWSFEGQPGLEFIHL